MALRVLLADESSTIKRVIQLALQDFGVDVKSVPVGLDVLAVSKSFHPDIIFADVLLVKRSGYEVSADIKNDPELRKIPVVLMWSGFMELDEERARASKADRRLEKPFDPDQLRSLVKELVPALRNNLISDYLKFPDRPEFAEDEAAPVDTPDVIELGGDEDENEDFRHVPLPKAGRDIGPREKRDDWSRSNLNRFKIETNEDGQSVRDIDTRAGLIDESSFTYTAADEASEEPVFNESPENFGPETRRQEPSVPALDFERAEQILRQQANEVLESIAWKIIPDIAERIVREELQKLLADSERFEEA